MRKVLSRLVLPVLACQALGLALACQWEADPPTYRAEESEATLFGSEPALVQGALLDRPTTTVDIGPTVDRWKHEAEGAAREEGSKELAQSLLVLTTISFQPAPVSVLPSSGGGGRVCSAANAGDTTCSTNSPGKSGSSACSTSGVTPPAGSLSCSVNVPNPGPTGGNNTTCSAVATAGATCSTGGTTGPQGMCSAQGGQTIPPTSNGASACSASGLNGGGNSCSANAGGAGQGSRCSTSSGGQHQSCSAGLAPTGTTATCSALGGQGAFCSINGAGLNPAGPPPAYGNQCSAILWGNSQGGGNANCSIQVPPGTGSCSVSSGQTGTGKNTQCSTFPTNPGGAGGKTTAYCSAFNAAGTPVAGGNCSVINPNGGTVISGPKTNPNGGTSCGGPYSGEGGTRPIAPGDPTT